MSAASAQGSVDSREGLSSIIERAKKEGVRVVIVDPSQKAEKKVSTPPLFFRMQTTAREVKAKFLATLEAIPVYWSLSLKALQNGGGDRSLAWPLQALAIGIGLLVIGWIPARLYARWAHNQFKTVFEPVPATSVAKISFLYLRALSELAEVIIQVGLAFLIALAFEFEPWGYRITVFLVLFGWMTYRINTLFFSNLLAVDASAHRLLPLSDKQARSMYRGVNMVFIPMIIVTVGCVWQEMLGMDHNAHILTLVIATAISALLLAIFVLTHRAQVAAMIRGNQPEEAQLGRRLLASSWHLIALAYIAVAYAVLFGRLVLGLPNAMFLAIGPIFAVFGAIAIYGAGLWLIEWIFQAHTSSRAMLDEDDMPAAEALTAMGNVDADSAPIDDLPSYRNLFVRWAQLFAVLAACYWLLNTWGLPISSENSSSAAISKILLIGFIFYLVWSLVRTAFDRKIAEEGGDVELVPGEEGGGAGSRLGTLLPLIRNFVLIFLSAIVAMMVLVEMNVNIGPIFAGAGIVGLAIGFGAQTLVKDVISGVFFLVDDAFRKGEYIDIGSVKGTVEKISVRSMQLRHHNGPLNTVPFGDIGHVTNFSRDWVVMKLPLRLTYNTDAEAVRKMIKKLGQEMMEDPVLGPIFLQPLKSQGVIQMEDSAMIMRVKFMTRPGDQWGIRRVVFAKIRDLFEENGIKFANREVTVRLADDEQNGALEKRTTSAIRGAAARVVQDDGVPAK